MSDESLFAKERQRIILEKLSVDSKVLVRELAESFGVSLATIRADLRELEQAGYLSRTHGGAIAVWRAGFEQNDVQKRVSCIDEKRRIAAAAADLVQNGDTIAVDTGTTAHEFAKALFSKTGLSVVTNDIIVASMLEEATDFSVTLLGGAVRRGFHCTLGVKALEALRGVNVDTAFLSANAFTVERGFMTPSLEHAGLKKRIKDTASKSVMLMDSHKIGKISFCTFAELDEIDVFVTDNKISKTVEKGIRTAAESLDLVIA